MAIVARPIDPPMPITLPGATWAAATISGARRLGEDALTAAVTEAYHALRDAITAGAIGKLHIVRMWNYIPGITEAIAAAPSSAGRDRYMAFNAGRFAAMCDWFGGAANLVDSAPAASGVGADGDDLIIHALASPRPGVAVQNAQQIPAALYSPRFGPRPPCFARATRVGDLLLVSGTAAIRGEATVGADLAGQLQITLENLAALPPRGLADYRSLRVFLPQIDHQPDVAAQLKQAMPLTCAVTFMRAELCRRDLLIEIEGVAGDSSGHGGAV